MKRKYCHVGFVELKLLSRILMKIIGLSQVATRAIEQVDAIDKALAEREALDV